MPLFSVTAGHAEAIRKAGLEVQGNELFYGYMVDNQAIVVPETADAIRALTRAESDGSASIARTNTALGIGTWRW
jgi:glyceraldehyde-3-phosphate dehydrogenase (NAD(P))